MRESAYTTVMTTMRRLAGKSYLTQERCGATTETRGFLYRPVLTRSELIELVVTKM
jgi:predicted transcriptional regulator